MIRIIRVKQAKQSLLSDKHLEITFLDKDTMTQLKKFDLLMSEVTSGKLEEKMEEIVDRMPGILAEEGLGTMDDMMVELRDFLTSKEKLDDYLDEEGTMKIPFETVFSWFKTSIEKKRQGLRD